MAVTILVGEEVEDNPYVVNMKQIRARGDDETEQLKWQYIDEADDTSTGPWVLLPTGILDFTVSLVPDAGSGYIEATIDDLKKIRAGDAVVLEEWDKGTVSVQGTMKLSVSAVAIRQVNVTGTTKMILTGQ